MHTTLPPAVDCGAALAERPSREVLSQNDLFTNVIKKIDEVASVASLVKW